MKTIALANQKGGVGKTTTAASLGIGLSRQGKKVLLIDADAQGNLTQMLGWPQPDELSPTLSTLMEKIIAEQPIAPGEGILHHSSGVHLVPANIELSALEVTLVNTMSRETVLRQYLSTVADRYDYALIDCMPSLGMLTINALTAADSVIIPVQAQYLPAKGLEQLLRTITRVKRQLNPKLEVDGIVLTMVDSRTTLAREINALIRKTYGGHVFASEIPRSIKAAEISVENKSIYDHDRSGKAALAYENLTREVLSLASKLSGIELTRYDDLFKTDAEREADRQERIQIVPEAEVFPYSRQPYTIDRPTPDLVRLMDSIEHIGIAEPLIVRPREVGGYEIISGHRRDYCAKAVGLDTRPVIVRNYSDEEADILVVDYNINREDLLPSEKAKAYKLKLDAMKRQAGRPSKNSGQVGQDFRGKASVDILAEQADESRKQVQRYIRLNKLIPPLLEAVDSGTVKFVPAADFLSHLSEKEQTYLLLVMERDEVSPSLGQAQRLKQLSGEGKLENNIIDLIMREEKPLERKVTIRNDRLQKYFPASYTPKQMEDVIIKLLEGWHRKRQQEQAR